MLRRRFARLRPWFAPPATPALLVALVLVVAACGATNPSSGTSGAPPATTGGAPAATEASGSPSGGSPSTEPPAETGAPADTETPGDSTEPTEPASPSESPIDVAAACNPRGTNPTFWSDAARAVSWTVLCAVLPKGWFVSSGTYRSANGGKLVIGYKGPAGATLSLSEGAFCTDGSGCVPPGTDGDAVPFGSLAGTLVRLDDGGSAIVVDRGLNPSWLLLAHGLDEATTVGFAAALAVVGR